MGMYKQYKKEIYNITTNWFYGSVFLSQFNKLNNILWAVCIIMLLHKTDI